MDQAPEIFCALDRPDLDGALALGRALVGAVGGLKVGLEFVTANGPDGVRQVATSARRCSSTSSSMTSPTPSPARWRRRALGVAMLTLHVSGGADMLRAAVETARCREPQRS